MFTWQPLQARLSQYLNQLHVALRHGLICRLYSLSHQIEAIKSQLQVRFTLSFFITQSMTVSQGKMVNQRLNSVELEIIDSTGMPQPAVGECVLMFHF